MSVGELPTRTTTREKGRMHAPTPPLGHAHVMEVDDVIAALDTSYRGLAHHQAQARLQRYGPNALPQAKVPGIGQTFLRQFVNPLIYVLLIAAVVSLLLQHYADATFIFVVLLINAVIGTSQEYSAEHSASALQELVTTTAHVQREGDAYEINARSLVPGDIVLLESGDKVPADLRLIATHGLEVDESLLTGESLTVHKNANSRLDVEAPLGDRLTMAFAGTLVTHGRASGVVVATGSNTELGRIATAVMARAPTKPPLLLRMEQFTFWVTVVVGVAVVIMAAVALGRGMQLAEIFLLAVALAVSAIPEGLPAALTVALAIGMRRMSRRNVIVRRLLTVEALGSCTYIASDKTGTLTVNELTVRRVVFPGQDPWEVTGEGMVPEGSIRTTGESPTVLQQSLLERLGLAVVLTNEGFLGHRDGHWTHHGDAVDVALLVMAHKIGITRPAALATHSEIAIIAFEPERRFSASVNLVDGKPRAFLKGALEVVLPRCEMMATVNGDVVLDATLIQDRMQSLASQGYRVLALASGDIELPTGKVFSEEQLNGLTLIGLVGMIDPLRKEAGPAVRACRSAGIEVGMVTGDHPATALAIARELGLASQADQAVTGSEFKKAEEEGREALEAIISRRRVFARVEPQQKLDIVQSLQRNGHFVAVTGDGANDAPALRAAHVGVAMGKSGTDVARETAGMIITDDNFASIVAGIEEGRVAYANVRKVIFLLISTGAAEIVLFTLALLFALPLPLFAVQLLWLNLVTNGIQDVALAFEPAEGGELQRPPRPPREPIFDRLMIERVVTSGLVMGGLAFAVFQWMLANNYSLEEARNGTLLLMVLFENIQAFNSRSERLSVFQHNPLRNPLLLFGTIGAQLIHIGAMYAPVLSDVLHIQPVSLELWAALLVVALSLLLVMELQKVVHRTPMLRAA